MRRSVLMAASALATATTWSATGWAQDADAVDDDEDVIVVTARKTEEDPIDVPISLSTFTDEMLQERRIFDITEISDFTPGFQQQQAFGRDGDRPVIRGASNILIAEGKVGFFIDGIPLTGDVSGLNLTNLERGEVIKGPQAALFGRGTLSGAVNFVTARPGDEHEFQVSGSVGNFDFYEIQGSWSGPITPWLGGYANVSYDSFGGDYDNNVTGGRLNERETLSGSGFLYFDPTENLSGSLRLIYQEVDDGHFAIDLQDASFNNVLPLVRGYFQGEVPARADSDFGLNTDTMANPGTERETFQVLGELNYDIGGSGWNASYIGGFTSQDEVTGVDQSYDETQPLLITTFVAPGVCIGFFPVSNQACGATAFEGTGASERESMSHEIRLSSPADRRVRGSIGYFYLDEERKGVPEFLEVTEFGLDQLGDIREIENNSVFASVEADITDRLTASAELRYSEDEITRTGQSYVASQFYGPDTFAAVSNPNPDQVVGNTNSRSASFDATLPRVTVRYALTPDINIFGQYAVGNSPGGFNPEDAPQTTIEEEELQNFEIGVKGALEPFDANFSASAFFIIYENQGLTQTYETADQGLDSYTANIGETEITGFEFEGSAELFTGFDVAATLAYLDAEITEGAITDQGVLFSPGGLCLDGEDFDVTNDPSCVGLDSIVGNTPPLVSDWQATLSGRYTAPLMGQWEWFAGGDLIYRSSFFAQVHNLAETGDSTRLNLQAGVQTGGIRIAAWGENVFDDDTPTGILRYVDFSAPRIIPGPPGLAGPRQRAFGITPAAKPTYGVTASVRF